MSRPGRRTPCYNLLPYTVRFFRTRFPPGTVRITVYDNESTDRTRELALKLGCEVREWKTGRSLRGAKAVRNMSWKYSAVCTLPATHDP